jgi:hypothetical protein
VAKEINDKIGKGTAAAIAANISSKENALTAHRIDGRDRAVDRRHVELGSDGNDLVRLLSHLALTHHDALPRPEGGDEVERVFRALLLIRASRRLAIDGNEFGGCICQRGDSGHEATLERAGVERGEDIGLQATTLTCLLSLVDLFRAPRKTKLGYVDQLT